MRKGGTAESTGVKIRGQNVFQKSFDCSDLAHDVRAVRSIRARIAKQREGRPSERTVRDIIVYTEGRNGHHRSQGDNPELSQTSRTIPSQQGKCGQEYDQQQTGGLYSDGKPRQDTRQEKAFCRLARDQAHTTHVTVARMHNKMSDNSGETGTYVRNSRNAAVAVAAR